MSAESWEAAARNAVETAARTVRDLRVAEATRFDVTIEDGKVSGYRVRLDISFKYDAGDSTAGAVRCPGRRDRSRYARSCDDAHALRGRGTKA